MNIKHQSVVVVGVVKIAAVWRSRKGDGGGGGEAGMHGIETKKRHERRRTRRRQCWGVQQERTEGKNRTSGPASGWW